MRRASIENEGTWARNKVEWLCLTATSFGNKQTNRLIQINIKGSSDLAWFRW